MIAGLILLTIVAQEAGNDVTTWLSNLGTPTVLTLCLAGAGIIFFVTRQILAVQKNVADQYIQENTKLRSRNDELEAECAAKDSKISELTRASLRAERDWHQDRRALEDEVARLKRRVPPEPT